MSDRLKELQRQRALAQEQVAWFDREIARETGEMPAVASLLEPQSAPPSVSPPARPETGVDPAADIMARYSQEAPGNMAKDAKRGCVLYFFFAMSAFCLLVLGVYALYLFAR